MPTVRANGLDIILADYNREPTGVPGMELLTLDMTLKNENRSTADATRPPLMEIRDDQGYVYTIVEEDQFTGVIEPGQTVRRNPRFEVAESATGLDLVFEPGTEDEAHVELV